MDRCLIITFLALSLFHVSANADDVPAAFTYQGRMMNANSSGPLTSIVDIKYQIYNPTGTCLLYEQTHSGINLATTSGLFSNTVGSPVGSGLRGTNDPGLSMSTVFSNAGAQIRASDTGTTNTCPSGYTPSNGDSRVLRVSVTDGGVTTVLSPDQVIGSQPYAVVAQSLQGLGPSGFIRVDGSVSITQSNIQKLVDGSDVGTMHTHDSLYVKKNDSANQNLGSGYIYTTGRIGVGTASPATDIEIERTNPTFRLEATSGGGGSSQIQFYSGATERARIESPENSSVLRFYTGGVAALTIDGNQNASFTGNLRTNGFFDLGDYDNAGEGTLNTYLTGCAANCKGTMWFNTDLNQIRYWNGSAIATVGDSAGQYLKIDGTSTMAGALDLGNQNITNVAGIGATSVAATYGVFGGVTLAGGAVTNLSAPVAGSDAANKSYVDAAIGSISTAASGAYLRLDGVSTMAGPLNLGSQNITNVAALSASTVVATNGGFGTLTSTTGVFGDVTISAGLISNLLAPVAGSDAANKSYVDAAIGSISTSASGAYLKLNGTSTMAGPLDLGGQNITNVAAPSVGSDATNKTYVDNLVGALSTASSGSYVKVDGTSTLAGNWNVGGWNISNVNQLGIGTNAPGVKLDVVGTIRVGDGNETCSGGNYIGAIRYNGGLQFCNGTSWQTLGIAGSGLTNFNGETGSSQALAIGTAGTIPNWASNSDVHTLNIPLASAANVEAGLISRADYVTFAGKADGVDYLRRDGTSTMTGPLDMGGENIVSAGAIGASSVTATTGGFGSVTSTSGTIGAVTMSSGIVSSGSALIGGVTIGSGLVQNLLAPVAGSDAANKSYVDAAIGSISTAASGAYLKLDGTSTMTGSLDLGGQNITDVAALSATSVTATSGGFGSVTATSGAFDSVTSALGTIGNVTMASGKVSSGSALIGGVTIESGLVRNLASPSEGSDATNKTYVDSLIGSVSTAAAGSYVKVDGTSTLTGNWNIGGWSINNVNQLGVGTNAPGVKLDVVGTIRVGDGNETCSGGNFIGAIRYNGGLQFCNGSSWQTLGVAGAGLTNLNGETGSSQTFAIGTSGTIPNWASNSDVHTLNIPLASSANVEAGLISKADYDSFAGKADGIDYLRRDGTSTMTGPLDMGGQNIASAGAISATSVAATSGTIGAVTMSGGNVSSATALIGGVGIGSGLIQNLSAPVSSGDAANKSYVDAAIGSISTAASGAYLKLDGTSTMTGPLDLGGQNITDVAALTATSVTATSGGFGSVTATSGAFDSVTSTSGTIGNVTMSSGIVSSGSALIGGVTIESGLVRNLASPTLGSDATNKTYVDALVGTVSTAAAGSYVKVDGTSTLTANWNVGGWNISNVNQLGIGTNAPGVKLDVVGSIRVGNGNETCAGGNYIGVIRYNGVLQYCNGTDWQTLGIAGSGFTTLNGQTGSSQSFTVGTSGTIPNWVSNSDVHTLNIPLASAANVEAGLISKADYESFSGKADGIDYLRRDGTSTMSGPLDMGGQNITDASAIAATSLTATSVTATNGGFGSVTSMSGTIGNVTMSSGVVSSGSALFGGVTIASGLIQNLSAPVSSGDAANKSYVDAAIGSISTAASGAYLKLDGTSTMAGALDLGGQNITDVAALTAASVTAASGGFGSVTATSGAFDSLTSTLGNVGSVTMASGKVSSATALIGGVTIESGLIRNLASPTADSDAANKAYVDGIAATLVSGAGVGDFMKDGSVTMTAGLPAFAGTALLPGYTFGGDLDTGFWSPGANTIAMSTGGATRMTIDSSGYVGIGTESPEALLHVDGPVIFGGVTVTTGRVVQNIASPLADGDAANKLYVDTAVGSISTAASGAYLKINGSSTMTGALDMGGQNITDAGAIDASSLTATNVTATSGGFGSVTSTSGNIGAVTMSSGNVSSASALFGGVTIASGLIQNLSAPVAGSDAANKSYVDAAIGSISTAASGAYLKLDGTSTMAGALDMGTQDIANVAALSATSVTATSGGFGSVTSTSGTIGAVTLASGQVSSATALIGGVTIESGLIRNLASPTDAYDAVNKAYVDSITATLVSGAGAGDFMKDGSVTMTGNLRIDNNYISRDGSNKGMAVSALGWVGVNTKNPSAMMHLYNTNDNTDATLYIENPRNSSGSNAVLFLRSTHSSADPYIRFQGAFSENFYAGVDSNDSGKFKIGSTAGTPAPGEDDHFVIDNSGNVGIATTSPGAKLHVAGTAIFSDVTITTGRVIQNLATPTANSDAATKAYVDTALSGGGFGDFKKDGSVTMTAGLPAFSGTTSLPGFAFGDDLDTGIWNPGANTIAMATGGTTHLTLDSSGRLGLGTNSPSGKLHTLSDDVVILQRNTAASTGYFSTLRVRTSNSGGAGADGLATGISFQTETATNSTFANTGQIVVTQTSSVAGSENSDIQFRNLSGGTEMTPLILKSSGNVGIGTISPGQKLDVAGAVQATAYYHTSDRRLKENFKPVDGLDLILKMNGYYFDWKDSGEADVGLIAQEVEQIFPQIVTTNKSSGMKSVKYGALVAPLIESTKELYGMCKAQQSQLDELAKRVQAHDRRLASQEQKTAEQGDEIKKLKNEIDELKKQNDELRSFIMEMRQKSTSR